jgi:hypothetical protein
MPNARGIKKRWIVKYRYLYMPVKGNQGITAIQIMIAAKGYLIIRMAMGTRRTIGKANIKFSPTISLASSSANPDPSSKGNPRGRKYDSHRIKNLLLSVLEMIDLVLIGINL